jgi:hypothetical protein
MTRRSYGASLFRLKALVARCRNHVTARTRERPLTYPETSLTMSRTKAVRLLKCPLMREMRCFGWRGVTCCYQILVS